MLSIWAMPALLGLGLSQRRALHVRTRYPWLLSWRTRWQSASASCFTVVRFRHATRVSCQFEPFRVMLLNHLTSRSRRVIGIGHQRFSPRSIWTLVRIMRLWAFFNAHAREVLPFMHFQFSRSGYFLSRTVRSPSTAFACIGLAISFLTGQHSELIFVASIMAGPCTRLAELSM